ncbi:MAG: aldehyde dehydrogenase family protein [Flavobacteriales bacterium]|nr:aldehyde dehydrogenase family protein [Flavobacteriales bacterium]
MTNKTEIKRIFNLQSKASNVLSLRNSSYKERVEKIKSIRTFISNDANHKKIADALYKDLKKSNEEVISTEITPTLLNIKQVLKNLKQWMKDEHVPSPLTMVGTSSYIKYESKGNILLISPWNYPIFLSLYPLIYAIASGNSVILKPSEISTHSSKVIKNIIQTLFKENEVAVIEGSVEESTELLKLPFNHIHFTGSPRVGKIVMEAAAKNLSGITLELGGKSPVIVDGTGNIKNIAQKIAWAKTLNCGQTCIAPDFALLKKENLQDFITHFKNSVAQFYNVNNQGIEKSRNYGRIVDDINFKRIDGILKDAVKKGAKIETGGEINSKEKFMSPTLLSNVTQDMLVMQEEIFGPILPVITFENNSDVIELFQKMPSPLAIYIMSSNKKNIKYFMDNTVSGGVCINELMLTVVNPNLPFGGVNNSGIGKSGGKHSFNDFSNEKGVVKKNFGNFLKLVYPPFKKSIFKYFKHIVKI